MGLKLREPSSVVMGWMDTWWMLGIGMTGLLLIVLGLKRDDVVRPIFLVAGLALAVFGFGGQYFGWKL
jgi:hypothetical protein